MRDPNIKKMKATSPLINPSNRSPNKAAPLPEKTHSGNYNSSEKDFSRLSSMSPQEVNLLHNRSDLDKSEFAQHHTLGPKRNQASPGDHIHDGFRSRGVGYGKSLTLTGSKGGNVALTNLLTMLKSMGFIFTDSTT